MQVGWEGLSRCTFSPTMGLLSLYDLSAAPKASTSLRRALAPRWKHILICFSEPLSQDTLTFTDCRSLHMMAFWVLPTRRCA